MIQRQLRSSVRAFLTGMLTAVLLAGSGSLVGCATIMSDGGEERPLLVTSTPEGATVYVKRGMADWKQQPGVTPTTIMLNPVEGGGEYDLRLELEGYEPVHGHIGSDIDPWLFGSMALVIVFVIPGIVATGIDLATDAWKKLDEDEIHFNFGKTE